MGFDPIILYQFVCLKGRSACFMKQSWFVYFSQIVELDLKQTLEKLFRVGKLTLVCLFCVTFRLYISIYLNLSFIL